MILAGAGVLLLRRFTPTGRLIAVKDVGCIRIMVGIGTLITPGDGLHFTMADGLGTLRLVGFGVREVIGVLRG
jgi:hypothetical protein